VSGVEPGAEAEPLHRALGLLDSEFDAVVAVLGRPPNRLELALFSVMWSEHCSYKSSRIHLRRLPTTGPGVLVGPGENAGVIDAGDGVAVAIRIESHNHPSAIEPYQGAATGVGGILRDIFTMGARPLAVMDPLFFGSLEDARQRWLFERVVAGISGYGNSVGVPTVGGELTFDPSYAGNPLVNVLCLGALPVERLVLGRASGPGNLVVLLGSTTGRDGIGGVSVLASAGFGASGQSDDDAKRPSVQVGDPFEEKRLIEACLALLDERLVVGIQDLGGAGLVCATSEIAARGGVGIDFDLSAVPLREEAMASYEVMTSESQERMLAVVAPESWPAVQALCDRWEVRASIVGVVTEPTEQTVEGEPAGRLRVLESPRGAVLADVPAPALATDAPLYERPLAPPPDLAQRRADSPDSLHPPKDCGEDLLALVADPSWVYRQYDHQLFLNTVVGPGGDAALLRLGGPGLPASKRGLAVTTDANPRWCAIDPRLGTALTVAECMANLACVGARPAAIVNCLNFGNPEHPVVMWQLSETVDGLAEACRAFELPVIGGNVSLYNESAGIDILPTPVIGMLGFAEHLAHRPPGLGWREGASIILLGPRASAGPTPYPLAGSRWAVEVRGHRNGPLAELDVPAHRAVVGFVCELVSESIATGTGLLSGVHDVSGGGLAVALAEMALAVGIGCMVDAVAGHAELFSEAPSRAIVASEHPDDVLARAERAQVPATVIGRAGGSRLVVDGVLSLGLAELARAFTGAIPRALGEAG
jgi:phosphoribosylformylglycinamidine synthase II